VLIPPFPNTGLLGSIRTPRILAAPQVSVPATQAVDLDPVRYRNGRDVPIFIERLALASGATTEAARVQLYVDIDLLGFSKITSSPMPAALIPYYRTIGNNLTSFFEFRKPFALMPNTGLSVRISNIASSAAARTTLSFIGYSESRPAPISEIYVPFCLTSAFHVAASTVADIPEESLRNTGKHEFIANQFVYYPVTSGFAIDLASLARLRSAGGHDVMLTRVDSRALRTTFQSTISGGMPLSGQLHIGPEGSASIEVESSSSGTIRHDVGLLGYKIIPLKSVPASSEQCPS